MILSCRHRYLFIEVPLTASWAIHHELCTYYDGVPILHKHASYPEFAALGQGEPGDLYVFATVRHPLDEVVSRYFKLKTDHNHAFSDPRSVEALTADYADLEKYRFVTNGGTFEQYVRRYHRRPFTGMIDLSAGPLDHLIRYESLQAGFCELLHKLGLEQVRPLPLVNKTAGRRPDWQSYYPPSLIQQVKASFGPFMQSWGYRFPAGWGPVAPSRLQIARYRAVRSLARLYLTQVRYRRGPGARLVRHLRATFIK
jgi:hypothetical protein